ncbi:TPA: transketolase family protein, partial [Streptococcus agalactiae]
MRCSTKEMRLVYRDFLLQANQENKQITVLEADLSSSMSTNALASEFGK